MSSVAPLGLTVVNPATKAPVVYIGVAAALTIVFVNGSGADVALPAGGGATLTLYFPSFYAASDLQAMAPDLSAMPGWKAAASAQAITLTYNGAAAIWPAGQALTLTLANVATQATGPSTDQTVQVNPAGLAGLFQVEAPLTLIAQPRSGNIALATALRATLAEQGIVYVSTALDPLANRLTLTLTNIGATPLYADQQTARPLTPVPTVAVSFVYGGTSGALLPDTGGTGTYGTGWDIAASIVDASGGTWNLTNPQKTDPSPVWTLSPDASNGPMLGTGANASVSFAFGNIVSYLAPGPTQMLLHFSGFRQSALVAFDPAVFFVDILKLYPPATRGVVRFGGERPLQSVSTAADAVTFKLGWTLSNTERVVLLTNVDGVAPIERTYGEPPPALGYDDASITLSGFTRTTTVLFTLQAFGGDDEYLNSGQFTGFVEVMSFTDPVDGRVYPAVRVGDHYWMAADLARQSAGGSYPPATRTGGRVYTAAAAAIPANPAGWRLPSAADYQTLFAALGGSASAYAALQPGGSSGFASIPTGMLIDGSWFVTGNGVYWTGDVGQQGQSAASLRGDARTAGIVPVSAAGAALAVRYVRDAR